MPIDYTLTLKDNLADVKLDESAIAETVTDTSVL
jgi:hypothetical protein